MRQIKFVQRQNGVIDILVYRIKFIQRQKRGHQDACTKKYGNVTKTHQSRVKGSHEDQQDVYNKDYQEQQE